MSGIPPPMGAGADFSGASATIASVVRMFLAMDAAFCSADRVTMAGSMMPALTRSTISPVSTFRPWPALAARHDALLEGRAGGLQRVLDAMLLLLHLGLGGSANLDHRDAAGQLGQPLLQLLAV